MEEGSKMELENDVITNATSFHERRRRKVAYFYKPGVGVSKYPIRETFQHKIES